MPCLQLSTNMLNASYTFTEGNFNTPYFKVMPCLQLCSTNVLNASYTLTQAPQTLPGLQLCLVYSSLQMF